MARKVHDDRPIYQQMDPGKAVGSCDGYFEPASDQQKQGVMREGKTYQDRLPVDARPRVQEWKKRKGK